MITLIKLDKLSKGLQENKNVKFEDNITSAN